MSDQRAGENVGMAAGAQAVADAVKAGGLRSRLSPGLAGGAAVLVAVIGVGLWWVSSRFGGVSRPSRGSLIGSGPSQLQWSSADVYGFVAVVLVSLTPGLQLARVIAARSVAGLSLIAWTVSFWASTSWAVSAWRNEQMFIAGVSSLAAVCGLVLLHRFWVLSAFQWRTVALTTAVCGASALLSTWSEPVAAVVGSGMAFVVSGATVLALLASDTRQGVSVAVFVTGAAGYGFYVTQGVMGSEAALASASAVLVVGMGVAAGVCLYLGVLSDDASANLMLFHQVKGLPRAIALHRPVETDGGVVDLELLWANDVWREYHEGVERGALAMQSRRGFASELLPVVRQAWVEGRASYFWQMAPTAEGEALEFETLFVRSASDLVFEWGDDVDAKIQAGSELELQRRQAERRRTRAVAKIATQEEQRRVARELHDNVLQEIFMVSLALEGGMQSGLEPEGVELAFGGLRKISTGIRELIEGEKATEVELALDDRLASMLDSWAVADEFVPEMVFARRCSDPVLFERIPNDVGRELTTVAKEAVSNAVKHAKADRIVVTVSVGEPADGVCEVAVEIADDGVGIPSANTRQSGLRNMSERAELVGGTVNVTSGMAGGTTVRMEVPGVGLTGA